MRIVSILSDFNSFQGIRPEFYNRQGYKITPISHVPKQKEIDEAISVTQNETPHIGMNGKAFMWGEDLVVKKYKPENEACSYDPMREIKVLDSMYEDKLDIKDSQKGLYAFEAPDGDTYLVSTQVLGKTIREKQNLSKQEMAGILNTLSGLDCGIIQTDENGKIASFKRPMHYDLSQDNIKTQGDKTGLLDFEYLGYDDIKKHIECDFKDLERWYLSPHLSDISLLPLNLRTFEHRALYAYLHTTKTPKKDFENYLELKSEYFKNLALSDKKSIEKIKDADDKNNIVRLYSEEMQYANFLHKNFTKNDIKKAEAMKIQLARFVFDTDSSNKLKSEGTEQFREYINKCEEFFNNKLIEAQDEDEEKYFSNCIKLVNVWKKGVCNCDLDHKESQTETIKRDNFIVTLDEIVAS